MFLQGDFVLLVVAILLAPTCQTDDTYTAAVVEYAPQSNPSLDEAENILNNVNNYIRFIHNASLIKADIIVFPETGLIGSGNKVYYSEIPKGDEGIIPCSHNITSVALTQLSCAARSYAMYVVVNLPERFINASTGVAQLFNTNVVFDRSGTIIARYRKYNLFGEPAVNVPPLEHVYFDTDFGVRFGVFICFDLNFEQPALSLVRDYNVRHFVFSSEWISELPFLTAIQSQWSWAYSQDVVLLSAGYNGPEGGHSGSGIYQGQQGALAYTMTDTAGSKLLWSAVSKRNYSLSGALSSNNKERKDVPAADRKVQDKSGTAGLRMLQDFIYLFNTELLIPPVNADDAEDDNSDETDDGTQIVTSLLLTTTLCQRSLCCDFDINMTATYSPRQNQSSSRGDDYNSFYYRLAVFDGVRTYSGYATGGVQLCSVIACVDDTLESCGLRADDVTASPNTYKHYRLVQSSVVFHSVHVDSRFSSRNSLVFPDVLVSGEGDSFGALPDPGGIDYQTLPPYNGSAYCELKTRKPLRNLVTFGIYSRLFDRDGQDVTPSGGSAASVLEFNLYTLHASLALVKLFNKYTRN